MPIPALLAVAGFVAINLAIGLRLLRIARGGGVPERLLALAFLGAATPAPVLQAITSAGLGSEWFQDAAFGAGRVSMTLGILCQLLFTWRVFRPSSAWAAAWVAALASGLVGSLLLYAHAGAFGDNHYRGPWFWAEWALQIATLAWTAVEALAHHARLRRQLALGLTDPVVCNRLLLWGIAGGAGCGALAVPALVTLLDVPGAGVSIGIAAPLGAIATSCYALTFFPPRAYRAWLMARHGAPR